jgi:hypothetical protein
MSASTTEAIKAVDLQKEFKKLERQLAGTIEAYQRLWDATYPRNVALSTVWTPQAEINARELARLRTKREALQHTRDEMATRIATRDSLNRRSFANMGISVPPSLSSSEKK